jgi:8-oxo-dGTP pyrophosphatase MutT (NUDIX family)
VTNWINERRAAGDQPTGADAAPASTVVVLRDSERGLETLLARRSSKLAFHGGAWVFPGGRIDPADYAGSPDLEPAARRAAVREAKEESGVDVVAETLVHFANWTTPEISPKRFATWFFAGPVAGGNEVADGGETEALQWFGADEALAARAAGEIELAPPQFVTLLDLRAFATVADAMEGLGATPPIDYTPRFHFVDGGAALCVYTEDVAFHDVGLLDNDGPRHRLLLADGGWEYIRDY